MRHLQTENCSVGSKVGRLPGRQFWKGMLSLLTVAGVISLAPAFAKDPQAKDPQAKDLKAKNSQAKVVQEANEESATETRHQSAEVAIPACLEKLKLSADQQGQVQEVIRNYDQSIGLVWQQFGGRYMQAVAMESLLLAAIEDGLSEPQRQQIRDQRRMTAKHEKAIAATSTKPNQATAAPDEETTKPATSAEQSLAVVEVSLTDEQETAAEKIQDKYRSQLRSVNRDIQGLHTRLVALECDKLVEIEKILTPEQLALLRETRQNAPDAPKVARK